MFRKFKTEMVFRSVVMIIAGIILIMFPAATQKTIAYVIAGALAVYGILRILRYFGIIGNRESEIGGLKEYASSMDLVTGILLIVFAALVAKVLIAFIPVVLGIVVLFSGLVKLEQAVELIRSQRGNWLGIMILAVVTIIVGVLSIFNPFATNNILLQVIGAGLAFGGITDLIATGYVSGKFKDMDDDF